MPLYNTKPVFLILVPLLMLHKNWNLSFEFSNFFGPYKNNIIVYQGDAVVSNGTIQLTKVINNKNIPYSVGRASYALPIQLYDPTIGLASFTTTFSFLISKDGQNFGDGIAFYIASPYHFNFKNLEFSSGGYLGLFDSKWALNPNLNEIVAVEFDTYQNEWDPPYSHVGVDINTIRSTQTVRWGIESVGNLPTIVVATVSYEALTHMVRVVVGTTINISLEIDLRKTLPDSVNVGFSSATGGFVETHKILSWNFSSSMH